jgi:hypothetical protein
MDGTDMSAAEALKAARDASIKLGIDGDDLVQEAALTALAGRKIGRRDDRVTSAKQLAPPAFQQGK